MGIKIHIDKSPKILAKYKNGNYFVTLYDDGTKIKENDLDFMEADFPESFDCKITNYCTMNCPMCHERSSTEGKHGNIMNQEFFNTLHPGMEIAIGGGMVTSHPDLISFLKKLKTLGVFPSMTVHQNELNQNWDLVKSLVDERLIYGLGVSYHHNDIMFWNKVVKDIPNSVIHLIAGYHKLETFEHIANYIPNAKILILGYKDFGRGHDYYRSQVFGENDLDIEENKLEKWLFNQKGIEKFKVVSFDNLALSQLNIKEHLDNKTWEEFYQGDDGTHTMYIDAVNEQFAKTSTSIKRYSILNNINEMFKVIKEED